MSVRRFRSGIARGLVAFQLVIGLFLGPAEAAVWLQIDSRTHVAPILRLAVDARRDLVVTASDDKTARFWSLTTGEPVAVFRPPVGPGQGGRVFAAAIHPVDDLVAVAGSGSLSEGPLPSIWLVQASNGRFVQRIEARGEHVRRLAWTADGQTLLACYADPGALRAFDRDGRLRFEAAYRADCLAVAAGGGSQVAAVSRDAQVHVYRAEGGSLVETGRFSTDGDPLAIAFSPDEKRIAVGFYTPGAGSAIHQVDSGRRLQRLVAPDDVRSPRRGDPISVTQAVAWSADGRFVHSAGSIDREGRVEGWIRRFDAASGRLLAGQAVSDDTVTDLAALPDGSGWGAQAVAWVGFAGDWGILGQNGNDVRSRPRVEFIVRRGVAELMLSPDARTVRWVRGTARTPVSFTYASRQVGDGGSNGLRPAITERSGSDAARNFVNNFQPTVRGARVALATGEISRALTYVGDAGDVVLATDRGIRRLDRALGVVWQVRTATEVRAVNASDDGRLVVTAMSDGTIRWWRADNGMLLLSLLATRDGWVLWSPTGHYDAGHGGESLIGWLVDRSDGHPVPDFFSVARFREAFHRPDVIDRILDLQDPEAAVRQADAARATNRLAMVYRPGSQGPVPAGPAPAPRAVDQLRLSGPLRLPPVLEALEPLRIAPGSAPQTIRFGVRAAGLPADVRLEVRLDGRLVGPSSIMLPGRFDGTTQTGQISLPLSAAVSTVQLVLRSDDVSSEPLRFSVAGDRIRAIEPQRRNGTLYLLAIGIDQYLDRRLASLNLAVKDARDFASAMQAQRGRIYQDVVVRLQADRQARREDLVEALAWLRRSVGEDDVGMVYLSGHGVNDSQGRYRFAAFDADIDRLGETGLTDSMLIDALGGVRGRAILFMDTCRAGALPESMPTISRETSRLANTLSAPENAVSVFAASTGRQDSEESDKLGNGVFTRYTIEGLRGGARLSSLDVVTSHSLGPYVAERVAQHTAGGQTPVALIPEVMPDRVLSVVGASERP